MRDINEISDVQAESGIIGTLIYHPEFIMYSDYLKASYFIGRENGAVYWAIGELYKEGITTIDAFNLTNKIKSNRAVQRVLEEKNLINVHEYIELYKETARNSVEEYRLLVNRVVTMSFKRDMVKALNTIENDCYNSDTDLEKLNNNVYRDIDKLTEKYFFSEDVRTLGSDIDRIWDEIVSRRTADGIYGLPSKYKSFNEYFTYEPGELVVIQAKYKRGKSVFLMNEVVDKLKNGVSCLVVDSEMPTRLYVERLLAHLSGVDVRRIKNGDYSAEESDNLARWRDWLKEQPFIHIYDPNMTMERLYAICKIQKRKMNLGFIVYDYIKSNATSSSDNYNLLGAMCDFLKNNIAGELDLPVLAACQLNRQGEVADSMKINRYLSVGIIWDFKTQENIVKDGMECGNAFAKIYVNRLGRQMMDEDEYIDFFFSGDNMTIQEATQHSADTTF